MKHSTDIIGSTLGKSDNPRGLQAGLVAFVLALYVVVVLNASLWRELDGILRYEGLEAFAAKYAVGLALVCAYAGIFVLLGLRGPGALFIMAVLAGASAIAYIADTWTVPIDAAALLRVSPQGFTAALADMPVSFWLWFSATGLLPCLIFLCLPIARRPFWNMVANCALFLLLLGVLTVLLYVAQRQAFTTLLENKDIVLAHLNPVNGLSALWGLVIH